MDTTTYQGPLERCQVAPDHEVHDYFVEKARGWLDDHGGRDVPHEALAIWAESVRRRGSDAPTGVIIARDGRLIAETNSVKAGPDGLRATYVRADDLTAHGIDTPAGQDWVLDMAMGRLTRVLDQTVVHVTASEVTMGASRRATAQGAAITRLQRATERRGEIDSIEAEWRAAIIAALTDGATQEQVAKVAGVTRARVGQIAAEMGA